LFGKERIRIGREAAIGHDQTGITGVLADVDIDDVALAADRPRRHPAWAGRGQRLDGSWVHQPLAGALVVIAAWRISLRIDAAREPRWIGALP
jgi:hypothetical protein